MLEVRGRKKINRPVKSFDLAPAKRSRDAPGYFVGASDPRTLEYNGRQCAFQQRCALKWGIEMPKRDMSAVGLRERTSAQVQSRQESSIPLEIPKGNMSPPPWAASVQLMKRKLASWNPYSMRFQFNQGVQHPNQWPA